jgi:hypothetical protein
MAFHRFLLRVCGRAPDVMVVSARRWLAGNRTMDVAKTMAVAAHAGYFTVTEAEANLLARVLAGAGDDWSFVTGLSRADQEEQPPYTEAYAVYFDMRGTADPDRIDEAAVRAAEADDVVGLWRAWRAAAPSTFFPSPKRLFLLQAQVDADAVALTARVYRALVAAGELHPLVEVFDRPELLPPLSRHALTRADVLWADRPTPPLRVAPTFDTIDMDGIPAFSADRPRLDEQEATAVAAYLASGLLLAPSAELATDRPDHEVVPTGLRGDGSWVWSEAAHYYLTELGVAPDPELLNAIRAADYTPPVLDAVSSQLFRTTFLTALGSPSRPGP